MDDSTPELHHYATPIGAEHHFFLDFIIEGPETFHDFFTILRQAGAEDVAYLHINSDGGRLDTAVQIIHAINTTEATVIGCAEGSVASAASSIFFSCHGFQIAEHCEFLIHNGRGGQVGKPNDNIAYAEAHNRRIENLLRSTVGRFFSKKEVKAILNGKEFFLTSEEVADRLTKVLQQEQEEEGEEDNE